MSDQLKAIAARYASALRVSESLAPVAGLDRPSVLDIWLWKLEETVAPLVEHWKKRKTKPDPGGHDHFHLYAHRHCLNSKEDVRNAPESVLLEAMNFEPSPLGWLQFMVMELGWCGMIIANWGYPVLRVGEDVKYSNTTVGQRRRQSVHYFLEMMRERGYDPLPEVRAAVEQRLAEYKEMGGEALDATEALRQLARQDEWTFYLYAYGERPNPPEVLTRGKEPAYTGEHCAQFAAEIRAAARRRRRYANVAQTCDCARLQAEQDEADGWEAERAGVEHVLKMEETFSRAADMGVAPEGEELAQLTAHLEAWVSSEYHIRNAYLHDRLEIYLARNRRAREQLRLPENRELAVRVKTEARWLHVPGVGDHDLGPSHSSGRTAGLREKAAEIRRRRAG